MQSHNCDYIILRQGQRPVGCLTVASVTTSAKMRAKEPAGLAFFTEATNILMLGPPSVGKTYLVIALALRAI